MQKQVKEEPQRYDSKVLTRSFHADDLVWRIRSETRKGKGKFLANWEGSFGVREATGNGAYRLELLYGKAIPRTWNASHLKFYFS